MTLIKRFMPSVALALVTALLALGAPANAYETSTAAPSRSGGTATFTVAGSNLQWTATATGLTTLSPPPDNPAVLNKRGYQATDYNPVLAQGMPVIDLVTQGTGCASVGVCTNRGTLVINFATPVRNPVFVVAGLGGTWWNANTRSSMTDRLLLTTPGVTLSKVSGSNLTVATDPVSGQPRIEPIDPNANTRCETNVAPSGPVGTDPPAKAGCGLVQANGVVKSLAFSIDSVWMQSNPAAPPYSCPVGCATPTDGWDLAAIFPEDFGDAPASYDQGNAARAIYSDITLGSDLTPDNVTVANSASSPNAGTDSDLLDDGVVLPAMVANQSSYTATVTVNGSSAPGQVCGWMDWNHNGIFDNTAERACATTVASASPQELKLTWSGLTGVPAGDTWSRFRVGYDTATANPTGASKNGEVEDYKLVVKAADPKLSLVKSVQETSLQVGQTLHYSFLVTNTGNTPVSNVGITEDAWNGEDPMGAVTCPTVTLQPTESLTCQATYVVQQEDVDRGHVDNFATATGDAENISTKVTSNQSEAHVPGVIDPKLTLDKTVSPTVVHNVGDVVTYTFEVQNTGNVSLDNLTIAETQFSGSNGPGTVTCQATKLYPGDITTCSMPYTVSQADIDAGVITNTAVAHTETVQGTDVPSNEDTAEVTAPAEPKIELEKSVAETELVAGQTLHYSFVVKNAGNTTLNNIHIDETSFDGNGSMSAITCDALTLAPNATTTCHATYLVNQDDVDQELIINKAVAVGTPPTPTGGTPPGDVTSPEDDAQVPGNPAPSLTLDKSVSPAVAAKAGDVVTYTFRVHNTGNMTLTNLTIDETQFTGSDGAGPITCDATVLAPDASTDCHMTYTVTQIDADKGVIDNKAVAHTTTKNDPDTDVPSNEDDAQVTIPAAPKIALDKSVTESVFTVGDTLHYTFKVTNTGNVTLDPIAVNETAFNGAGSMSAIDCPVTKLAPGVETTCTATYVTQQADVDRGFVDNTAVATGVAPDGDPNDPTTSQPDNAHVPAVPAAPSLTLKKTANTNTLVVGQTATYDFEVQNTGNVTLTGVAINEVEFTGNGAMSPIVCDDTVLAPNDVTHCHATYVVQQSDFDDASVYNKAVATGIPPNTTTPVPSNESDVTLTGTPAPSLSLEKSVAENQLVAGGTLHYSFVVKNTGNVTLTNIHIDETSFDGNGAMSPVVCDDTTLAPDASTTCHATYLVNQDDVDQELITNKAVAVGTPPTPTGGTPPGDVTSPEDDAKVPGTPAPSVTLDKTVTPTVAHAVGDVVTYTFRVHNTGNVTLTNLTIDETQFTGSAGPGLITCDDSVLSPDESTDCHMTYTVTQIDVDKGVIDNKAVAHTNTKGDPDTDVPSNEDDAKVTIPADPSIALDKSVTEFVFKVGDTLHYTFKVTNTGNVTLDPIAINETAFNGVAPMSAIDCPVTKLAPGVETSCTATYVAQQADVDRGFVDNTAVATGVPPNGDPNAPISSEPDDAHVPAVPAAPSLTLKKTANTNTLVVGQTATYDFEVQNTGNVTLTGVEIDELDFTGNATMSGIVCDDTVLSPNEITHCHATYVVQQSDLDDASVYNNAVATGVPPNTNTPVPSNESEVTITGTQTPGIRLVKSVAETELVVGGTLHYTFDVENIGNVTLTNIHIDETSFDGNGSMSAVVCDDDTLLPGTSTTCSATYLVNQDDVDQGVVINKAVAVGTPPTPTGGTPPGDVTSPEDDAQVPGTPDPSVTLDKSVSPGIAHALGDVVTYTFHVHNTGNVTLTNLTIDETQFTGSAGAGPITCDATTLSPDATTDCHMTYTVTQIDVDKGVIDNKAIAHTNTEKDPDTDVPSNEDDAKVTIPADPSITLDKSVTESVFKVGDTLHYTFTVTNTGNVTLDPIAIKETSFSGAGAMSAVDCLETKLAPGVETTCTATYVAQQADVDRGFVDNVALATGVAPNGDPENPTTSETDDAHVPAVAAAPSLKLTKTANTDTLVVGQTATYDFEVENTGNVTLTGLVINDTDFTGNATMSGIVCDDTVLSPNEITHCHATYIVQQSDLDDTSVYNKATASGVPPNTNTPVPSNESDVTITGTQDPSISLEKSVAETELVEGGTLHYTFDVKNTGNVTLTDVHITETDFNGSGAMGAVTCDATELAPNATTQCHATYTVSAQDVAAGRVDNTAVSVGTPPTPDGGEPPADVTSPESHASVPEAPEPHLTLVKTVSPLVAHQVGDEVVYTFHVTNDGNVAVEGLTIDETEFTGSAGPGEVICQSDELAPGQATDCTMSYTMTQADVDAGVVNNKAIANASTPTGNTPVASNEDDAQVTIPAVVKLTLKKSVAEDALKAGSTLHYSFLVTNTGNVTLDQIAIDETEFTGHGTLSAVTCPVAALAPNQSTTCTATYVVTAADVVAGSIANTAIASGVPPHATTPVDSNTSTAVIPGKRTEAAVPDPGKPGTRVDVSTFRNRPSGPTRLAYTGSQTWPLVSAAGFLILAGVMVAGISRRRRLGD